MNLPFSTVLNGKKTHFIEKIWTGLIDYEIVPSTEILPYVRQHTEKFGHDWDFVQGKSIPKIHTIRKIHSNFFHKDEPIRFKKGTNIHFVINNRTKNYFRFAPVIPVISNQIITFDYTSLGKLSNYPGIKIFNVTEDGNWGELSISKELRPFNHFEYITDLQKLAENDGFERWEDLLDYFNEDGIYNIIHWTNFRY